MASTNAARNNLAELRRAAGYNTGKEFAKVLGIPVTTYARYERGLAEPSCGIPMAAAWNIADKLHVSIDAVVGRSDAIGAMNNDLNATYRSLSASGQKMLDEYVRFLDFRDRILVSQVGE